MLRHLKAGLLLSLSLVCFSSMAAPTSYNIDATHTTVIATWNHFGFSNPSAAFSDVTGTIVFDPQNPSDSSVSVTIPVNTVDTFVPKLTEEFLAKEYFDVAIFPNATFTSTKVVASGEDTFDVTGKLTIKGTSKTVTFSTKLNGAGVHPMSKKQAIGFDAHTTIKRSDFGIDKYVPYVSDEVSIRITTEAQAD